jgi:hypothetical protein
MHVHTHTHTLQVLKDIIVTPEQGKEAAAGSETAYAHHHTLHLYINTCMYTHKHTLQVLKDFMVTPEQGKAAAAEGQTLVSVSEGEILHVINM